MSCKFLDAACTRRLMARLDVVIFDCDGVLWRGDRAVEGCAAALRKKKQGLTSVDAKLVRLGYYRHSRPG